MYTYYLSVIEKYINWFISDLPQSIFLTILMAIIISILVGIIIGLLIKVIIFCLMWPIKKILE